MLSIVIPVLNEAPSLRKLYEELHWACAYLNQEVEYVFVDDGSTDDSWEILSVLVAQDPRLVLVRLRHNSGKSVAYAAGFREACGDCIATLDADLQDDPAELRKLFEALEQHDLVVGWKWHRQDPAIKVWSSFVFNAIANRMAGVSLHDQNSGFRMMRREVALALPLRGELYRMIPALAAMQGFRVAEVPVRHRSRQFGVSKYGDTGLRRMFRGLFDLLTVAFLYRFRARPFHFFGAVGGAMSLVGFLINVYLSIVWLGGASIGSRPLLLLGVLLMVVGVQLVSTGFLADLVIMGREREEELPIAEIRRATVA